MEWKKPKPSDGKASPIVRGGRQKRLLSEAIMLEEEVVPDFVRVALLVIAALVVAFTVWAAFVDIEEVAIAPGEIIPSDKIKIVQHLEGGMVDAVLVEEGQFVKGPTDDPEGKGTVLLRLDPAQVQAELDQLKARRNGLQLRAERLAAFLNGREANLSGGGSADGRRMAADQQEILRSQEESRKTSLQVIDAQIEQRQKEIAQLNEQLRIAAQHQALAGQELSLRQQLADKGLVSKMVLLETQRAKVTADGEVQRLRDQIKVATDSLSETRSRRGNTDAQIRQDAATEQGTISAELAQVTEAIKKAEDRVKHLDIRAPVSGLVQDLKHHNRGEVIAPGGPVLQIVPVNDTLDCEVRISSRDVGHVLVGQSVTVKVSSYDYSRYGGIPGVVKKISPSSYLDENNQPYYRGVVTLARPYIGPQKGQYPVIPGMSVQGDIITGSKTLLEYLLKPVVDSLNRSFRER